REQPRPQIRARLETRCGTEGLEIRILHQVFGVGRVPRQAQSRPVEAVDCGESFGVEAHGLHRVRHRSACATGCKPSSTLLYSLRPSQYTLSPKRVTATRRQRTKASTAETRLC